MKVLKLLTITNMITFKQHYITEASAEGKNLHMTHIEDQVLYGGVQGARDAITALRSMRDMLAGNSEQSYDVAAKFDGAPAIFVVGPTQSPVELIT